MSPKSWLPAIFFWKRRRITKRALLIVMYSRPGCHLCDEAWRQLLEAKKEFTFDLRAVEVDTDTELAKRYGSCVPVIEVNGKVRFRGRINSVLLRRLLVAS
jgi:glutaredoxin